MDEEITIIDSNTRNEKIKNFFIVNKKNLIIVFSIILVAVIGYLSIKEVKEKKKRTTERNAGGNKKNNRTIHVYKII